MLLTVSIALAYFVGRTLLDGKGASTTVTTANIHGATLKVEGELNFNAEGMFPGHRDISRIKVTATGNNELIPYNLIWTGNNTLATNLKFTVYKTSNQIETSSNCKKHDEQVSGGRKLYETCDIKNENQMGEVLTSGTIQSSEESINVELAKDEFINATPDGQVVYYYIIIEYPNENSDQYPKDKGGSFNGVINAEASDTKPDINIIAAYIENKDTDKYEKTDTIPQEGYVINQEKTVCNNGAKPTWDNKNKGLLVTSFTKSGTECELYFDKIKTSKEVLADLGLEKSSTGCPTENSGELTVTGIEETQKLICSAEDNDSESYYFRGVIDNNWVKFGKTTEKNEDIWWRILRINGDGTIRLIYSGIGNAAPSNNGTNAIDNQVYNEVHDDNTYVGFYNQSGLTFSYPAVHQGTNPSDIAKSLNTWFTKTTKLSTEYINHIDENAGFCNDRKVSTNNHGMSKYTNEGYGNKTTYYVPFDRVAHSTLPGSYSSTEQKPTLKCGENNSEDYERDYFTWKNHSDRGNKMLIQPIGLITMDEVILAGGFAGKNNDKYWLYTGQWYWTMSPYNFADGAEMFAVQYNGYLNYGSVYSTIIGARPVINLKANTPFEPSNNNGDWGTTTNPYIVKVD